MTRRTIHTRFRGRNPMLVDADRRERKRTLERAACLGVKAEAMNAVRLTDQMVAMTSEDLDAVLDRLAPPETAESAITHIARTTLGLETLETRRSDRLDFHDLAVWQIKQALQAAYEAGRASAK
jgi:hypothetical protein